MMNSVARRKNLLIVIIEFAFSIDEWLNNKLGKRFNNFFYGHDDDNGCTLSVWIGGEQFLDAPASCPTVSMDLQSDGE